MKLSVFLAGALLALSASAAKDDKVVTTVYQTVTKYTPFTVTLTETLTKEAKTHVTETETITAYKTKTLKVCSSSASPTASVMKRDLPGRKGRAFGDQPLYANEFA